MNYVKTRNNKPPINLKKKKKFRPPILEKKISQIRETGKLNRETKKKGGP